MFVGSGKSYSDTNLPGPSSFEQSSTGFGIVKTIDVVPTYPGQCYTANLCQFFFTVSPWTSGAHLFVIEITNINGVDVLSDGQTQAGMIPAGSSNLFSLVFPVASATTSVAVSFNVLSGAIGAFATITPGSAAPPSPPNASLNDYSLPTAGRGTSVLVLPSPLPKCSIGQPCFLYLNVTASLSSSFTVTATSTAGITNLTEGVPYEGVVAAGQGAYFAFAPQTGGNISIALTAFSGLPAVYVSTTTARPGPNTNFTCVNDGGKGET